MSFDVIQMPSKYLKNTDDPFSWRLHVLSLNTESKSTAVVGRHSACDFRIDPKEFPCFISRKHAQFDLKEEKLFIKDLESANGTFKNDVMLTPNVEYALSSGDYVAFGSKREQKTVPGETVQKQDTPFLFKVMKSDSLNSNVTKTVLSRESGESSTTFNSDISPIREGKGKETSSALDNRTGKLDETSGVSKKRKLPDPDLDETVVKELTPSQLPKSVSRECIENSSEKSDLCGQDNVSEEIGLSKNTNAPIIYNKNGKSKTSERNRPKRRKTKNFRKNVKKNSESSTSNQQKVKTNGTADPCASFECRIPSASLKGVIDWVQCDSCDQWFHTMCVGCDYNKVSDQTQQFHCGCCES